MAKPVYGDFIEQLKAAGMALLPITNPDYRKFQQNLGHALRDRGLKCSIRRIDDKRVIVTLLNTNTEEIVRRMESCFERLRRDFVLLRAAVNRRAVEEASDWPTTSAISVARLRRE